MFGSGGEAQTPALLRAVRLGWMTRAIWRIFDDLRVLGCWTLHLLPLRPLLGLSASILNEILEVGRALRPDPEIIADRTTRGIRIKCAVVIGAICIIE